MTQSDFQNIIPDRVKVINLLHNVRSAHTWGVKVRRLDKEKQFDVAALTLEGMSIKDAYHEIKGKTV